MERKKLNNFHEALNLYPTEDPIVNKQLYLEELKWLGAGACCFKWLSHLEPLFKPSESKWQGLPFKMADSTILNSLVVKTAVNKYINFQNYKQALSFYLVPKRTVI